MTATTTIGTSAPTIYALHGFLGLTSDWDFLKPKFQIQTENLWTPDTQLGLKDWTAKRSAEIGASLSQQTPRILLGYSMGGRLAMHLLLAMPRFWDAAILVSAHPGTASVDERVGRADIDHKWAQKFLKDDWSTLMNAWNKQGLFGKNSEALARSEKDFSRERLAQVLENWSLSKQDDLAQRLAGQPTPILWMAGEQDEKYRGLLSGFPKVSGSHEYVQISKAAHRVPWDNPVEFMFAVENFLKARFR